MKMEGRQHGLVRSFCIIPSPLNPNYHPRVINKFDSPTTAGLFTKVTSKPTNHSKFTGRCGKPKCSECHVQPACKSKYKAKGSHKLKSTTDISTDCKYMSWQVVDQTTNETKKSFDHSASGILDRLTNYYDDYVDYDYDYDEYDDDVWSIWSEEMRYDDDWSVWSIEEMRYGDDWFFHRDDYLDYDNVEYAYSDYDNVEYEDVEQEALYFEEKFDMKRSVRKRRTT